MKKRHNVDIPPDPPKINLNNLNKKIAKKADEIFLGMLNNLNNKKKELKEKDPSTLTKEEEKIIKGNEIDFFTKFLMSLEKKQLVKNIEDITDLEQLTPYLDKIKDVPNKKINDKVDDKTKKSTP